MAGDWIKMRNDLPSDPAVIRIRRATGLDADSVVGKLHRLWSWADTHTSDGLAAGLDAEWVDEFAGAPGFSSAMHEAGWLEVTEDGVRFANFERHNGRPAKSRALAKSRMKRSRCADSATESQHERNTSATREEKRREENETHTHTPAEPDVFRQPGWAADEWSRFVAAWNVTERAEPWPHLTAPDGWADLAATPGWLQRAREALARLPSRQYFDRPLPVTRFFDYVDRIRAGEFADPKTSARARGRQPAGGNL
jgi:hypothetical protein